MLVKFGAEPHQRMRSPNEPRAALSAIDGMRNTMTTVIRRGRARFMGVKSALWNQLVPRFSSLRTNCTIGSPSS